MKREDDVQLIHDILSGDDEAFSVLVQKHQKSVHALVWRKIGDFHHAEEITQDTFLQVYKKLPTLKDPHKFAGWLYVIANRLCIDWMRKNNLITQSLEDTSVEEIEKSSYTHHVSEQQQIETSEHRRDIVKKLLARLPESERTVVTLYYLGEMKVKEISKFLGVSVSTIHVRLHRARKRLQEKEEHLVQEVLGGVQIPTSLIQNIMREIPRIKPLSPTGGKLPVVPWAIAASTTILIVMMLGISNQYLARFQHPYSFDATSEMTVELIEAPIVIDLPSKPDVRNQLGNTDGTNKKGGTVMKLNDILESHFNAIGGLARLSEIQNVQRSGDAQLTQWNGQPVKESGKVEIAAVVGKKSYTKLDFGELFREITVWNGTDGWKSVMGNSPTILPETEYGRARSTIYMDPLQAIHQEHGSKVFQQDEDELFRGKECSVIRVIDSEDVFYIDKASNLLVGAKTTYTGLNTKDAIAVLHYDDYTDYEGVMLPNSYAIFIGEGALTVSYAVTKTEIDTALDATIFEKP